MKTTFTFKPMPHEEAAGYIEQKDPVGRKLFDALRPELKARAFVVTGVEDLNVVREIRDAIAGIPRGGDWEEAKKTVEEKLGAYYGEEQSTIRATILLRYHVFQAYGAAHYRQMKADGDVYTHWQYRATGDGKVRESHAALDGLVLPQDHAFWQDHFPPWEYNCRCQVVPLLPEEVEDIRAEDEGRDPAKRLVLEGAPLEQLETQGRLDRGANELFDVRSARAKATGPEAEAKAFRNDPGDLTVPLAALEERADPEDWQMFRTRAEATEVEAGLSLWGWLLRGEARRKAKRKS